MVKLLGVAAQLVKALVKLVCLGWSAKRQGRLWDLRRDVDRVEKRLARHMAGHDVGGAPVGQGESPVLTPYGYMVQRGGRWEPWAPKVGLERGGAPVVEDDGLVEKPS